MLDALRKLVLMVSARSDKVETAKDVRRLAGRMAKSLRSGRAVRDLEGIARTMELHATETSSWVDAGTLAGGGGGPFDACDLRHWLVLADRAGVPSVPARVVLELTEDDLSSVSGSVDVPDDAVTRGVRKGLAALVDGHVPETPDEPDAEAVSARLFDAMDGVPEGWMVRSARCGGSELKAWAGFGAGGPTPPEVRFGPDVEVGPGWVREGNRRRVRVEDRRTMQACAEGPGGAAFLARPWVEAGRYAVGEDPHRHGTQFAGKGIWPAEWRAFVEDGQVVGVASYYGWCGSATPYDAAMALLVRARAQAVADEATALSAWPRYMDVEFVRSSGHPDLADPRVSSALDVAGRDKVGCTLDFLETREDGPVLLEGGPANTPFGGGHPCAFAGCGGPPTHGRKTETRGVAFRTMDHVTLGDPSTWTEGDRTGSVLPWTDVEALASGTELPWPVRVTGPREPFDWTSPPPSGTVPGP